MYMTLKSSGNGSKASMVQVSSSIANGKGERARRAYTRKSEAATFRGFIPNNSRRADDSARRSQDSASRKCNPQYTRSSISPVQKQSRTGAGRQGSFSDGRQVQMAAAMDQNDDMLYDTDSYQDVLNLLEASPFPRPFDPASIDTAMTFEHLLRTVGSPGPLSDLGPPTATSTQAGGCTCTNDLLQIVQQFDDNDFGLKTLSLDEVMKLQKWILFQCCQPLDCLNCQALPTIHTILLIICDRLTEVFECIHRRIKRVSQQLTPPSEQSSPASVFVPDGTADKAVGVGGANSAAGSGHSPPEMTMGLGVPPAGSNGSAGAGAGVGMGGSSINGHPHSHPQTTPPAAPAHQQPSFGNLFGAATDMLAGESDCCNPSLFPPEIQRGYSDEEQLHMIRVLLKLQTRNFRGLLLRLDGNVSYFPSHSNEARRAKVKSLLARLSMAEAGIENALRSRLQELFTSMPHLNQSYDGLI